MSEIDTLKVTGIGYGKTGFEARLKLNRAASPEELHRLYTHLWGYGRDGDPAPWVVARLVEDARASVKEMYRDIGCAP